MSSKTTFKLSKKWNYACSFYSSVTEKYLSTSLHVTKRMNAL